MVNELWSEGEDGGLGMPGQEYAPVPPLSQRRSRAPAFLAPLDVSEPVAA